MGYPWQKAAIGRELFPAFLHALTLAGVSCTEEVIEGGEGISSKLQRPHQPLRRATFTDAQARTMIVEEYVAAHDIVDPITTMFGILVYEAGNRPE